MTFDELEDHEAILCMWMRRAAAHPMLEVAIAKFQIDLARLDKEVRDPTAVPTFEQEMDRVLRERAEAIRSGRTGT